MYTRKELHHLVLDVEFVLISVVQGVALTTLAMEAAPMLRTHDLMTYAFVGTGLLFILSFWSVALVHALSFLTWPMDLVHYFFYFAVALVECLTFTQMQRPRDWFGYSIASFALSTALYVYDARLIRSRRPAFAGSDAARALYAHIAGSQRFEMGVLMPAGLAFCIVAYGLVARDPARATALALVQFGLTLGFVANFVATFRRRQQLISACMGSDAA